MIFTKVMNLNWGLVNKFLRIFMIPLIQETSYPTIQILINHQIRKKGSWRILQRSAKKEIMTWNLLLPTVMKRWWIQRFFIVVQGNWDWKENAFKPAMILMFATISIILPLKTSIKDNLQLSSKMRLKLMMCWKYYLDFHLMIQ